MQITVKWGGVDVVVEMKRREGAYTEGGFVGATRILLAHAPEEWDAMLAWPEDLGMYEHAVGDLTGSGATAQEALDALAEQLSGLMKWAYSALHPSAAELPALRRGPGGSLTVSRKA